MMSSTQGPLASAMLRSARKAHAAGVTLRMSESAVGGSAAFGDVTAHNESLIEHLSEALALGRPALFQHHVGWLRSAFGGRDVPLDALLASLTCLRDELNERLPPQAARIAVEYVDAAIAHAKTAPDAWPSQLGSDAPHARLAANYLLCCLEGRRDDAIELVTRALADGMSVADVFQHVLGPAQVELGVLWQRDEIHIAEEHMVSRTTEQVIAILATRAARAPRNGRRVLVTSASGDLHDLGPRMIATVFELAGFETIFLGASTPAEDVAKAVEDLDVHLIALSAKLDLHVRAAKDVVSAVRARRSVPVIVGGTPFTLVPDLWKVVGADATARTPAEAVEIGLRLTA